MGEKTELKACPFDDGLRKHRVMVERQQGRAGTACPSKWFRERVACSCGARGAEFKRPGRAITAWNTRAQPSPQDQGSLPDGWRPIETALRHENAAPILACGGGLDEPAVVTWNDRVGAWDAPLATLDDRDEESDGYNRPTHWMPLPAPPEDGR